MGTSNRKYTPVVKFHFGFGIKPRQQMKIGQVMIMREIEDCRLNGTPPWTVDGEIVELVTTVSGLTVERDSGWCDIEIRLFTGGWDDEEIDPRKAVTVSLNQQHAFELMISHIIEQFIMNASVAQSTIFDGAHAELEISYRSVKRSFCSEP